MMITANGFFEGEGHDLSWHNANNAEFQKFAVENLATTDTLVFGRTTYDLMASFWPTEQASNDDAETAKYMDETRKVVFTHRPLDNEWHNVETSDDVVGKMMALKNEEGGDISVLGSSNLCVTLLREGLLDELRIMVNPLAITAGTPLFDGIEKQYDFDLTATRTFDNGNVLLTYTVKK
jgi:dihydrofolate reductase